MQCLLMMNINWLYLPRIATNHIRWPTNFFKILQISNISKGTMWLICNQKIATLLCATFYLLSTLSYLCTDLMKLEFQLCNYFSCCINKLSAVNLWLTGDIHQLTKILLKLHIQAPIMTEHTGNSYVKDELFE